MSFKGRGAPYRIRAHWRGQSYSRIQIRWPSFSAAQWPRADNSAVNFNEIVVNSHEIVFPAPLGAGCGCLRAGAFPHVRSRRRQCLSVENHLPYVGEMLARPSGCVFHMCFYTFSHRQEKRFANHVFPPADTVSSEVGQGFWAPPFTCFRIRFSTRDRFSCAVGGWLWLSSRRRRAAWQALVVSLRH